MSLMSEYAYGRRAESVILLTAGAGAWSVIPFAGAVLLGGTAGVFAYRLWRRPYEGPPEGKA